MASSFSALFLYLMGIIQVWEETLTQVRTYFDKHLESMSNH